MGRNPACFASPFDAVDVSDAIPGPKKGRQAMQLKNYILLLEDLNQAGIECALSDSHVQ